MIDHGKTDEKRTLNAKERKKLALKALGKLSEQIESGELEVDELVQEVGVTASRKPGEVYEHKEPSGDEVWTLKVYRKGRPRATYYRDPPPGIGTWRAKTPGAGGP
jgi:hypothetical protein